MISKKGNHPDRPKAALCTLPGAAVSSELAPNWFFKSQRVWQEDKNMDPSPVEPKHSFIERLRMLVSHFAHRLKETPLLLGWLVIGLLVTLVTDGWMGLALGLANYALAGGYVLFIRWMTPNPPAPEPVKRPRLELALGLGLLGLFLLIQLLDFDVWTIQPWYGWVKELFRQVYAGVYGLRFIPDWAQQDVYLAASSTIKQLIPALLLFCLLGYRRSGMGLARPHWQLSTALLGITAFFGLVTGLLSSTPLSVIVGLYLTRLFVNALPEELFFRGFLLPRLEKALANPLNALVVSALLFNALHIPIEVRNGVPPLTALLSVFGTGYPSGLLWGYLYLRTRSIIPGMLWHGANQNLGFILMSQ